MKAEVLYCHPTKFTGSDDREISGYQTGVVYDDSFMLKRCREIWTRESFTVSETANLVYSKRKQKWYLFKVNANA